MCFLYVGRVLKYWFLWVESKWYCDCDFLYDYGDEDGGEADYDDADDYEERVKWKRH